MQLPDVSQIADKVGFRMTTIKSANFKDTGSPLRGIRRHERELLQGTVDNVHKEFVQAIVDGRKLNRKQAEAVADGRIILGRQALDLRLVDDIGNIYEAARKVYELAEEPLPDDEMPKLRFRQDRFAKFRQIFEGWLNLPQQIERRSQMQLMYLMQ